MREPRVRGVSTLERNTQPAGPTSAGQPARAGRTTALLEDEWDDRADPTELPLADLREALRARIDLLERGPDRER